MLEIAIYMIIIFILFSLGLSLHSFKKEMLNKMQYYDFVIDAKDGILNDFSSNSTYAHSSTKGIAIYKDKDGQYEVVSQSKLYGASITH